VSESEYVSEKVRVSLSLTVSECDLLHGGCTDRTNVTLSSSLLFSLLSITDSLVCQRCLLNCCTVAYFTAI
jgi:hypothetical protein